MATGTTLLVGATAGVALVLATQSLARKRLKRSVVLKKREDHPSEEEEEEERIKISPSDVAVVNTTVLRAEVPPEQCIRWAAEAFGEGLVMSTSFGMQSAVLLHMATRLLPNIPVIWIDTGYLHRETYLFAQHLAKRLDLQLRVYQSDMSPARMEALHGKLWQRDDDVSHRVYGAVRKVAPMNRALQELGARAMLSGIRKSQTDHRSTLDRLTYHPNGHFRVHPLLHWTKSDVDDYIAAHKLPYHPLKRKGYVSVGDAHSTKPLDTTTPVDDRADRATRFGGKRQECGLHTENGMGLDEMLRKVLDEPTTHVVARDDRPIIGTGEGFEIYGRPSCRFCEAARRILASRNLPYAWTTMQRFNQTLGKLEPPDVDGVHVVSRADVERRVQRAAPGSPPIETVPQIFEDGEYVGGFAELCVALRVPKTIVDVALLDIGGLAANEHGWANTWNVKPSLRRGPSLNTIFQ
ncbi:hypothetical protein CTAYLR_004904 [Chrysophaeum taylorii]|uniref:Phosphoadenosine phosphosulphate reductase domain-containing protein n=1 Tax=Chrysophaeum taylorii TaxID=2483200 RepID=A0AAD7XUE4_9STRA|nr:hypothetical protein CTAYLR_004904 [Chrysophaeum taylorii]